MALRKLNQFGRDQRLKLSNALLVRVKIKSPGEIIRSMIVGWTYVIAILGVLLCCCYFLLVTLPHSLWIQEVIFGGSELFPKFLKQPGLNILAAMTRENLTMLSQMNRANVAENCIVHFLDIAALMGYKSSTFRNQVREEWASAALSIDLTFIVGLLVSALLASATSGNFRTRTSIILTLPYVLFVVVLFVMAMVLSIYLNIEFHSDLRQNSSSVRGEHILLYLIGCLFLLMLVLLVVMVSSCGFIKELARRCSLKQESERATEASWDNNSAENPLDEVALPEINNTSSSEFQDIPPLKQQQPQEPRPIDHFELGEILSGE